MNRSGRSRVHDMGQNPTMRTTLVFSGICACIALACGGAEPDASTGESAPALESESAPKPEPEPGPPAGAWVVIDERRGLFESPAADRRIPILLDAGTGSRLRVAEVVAIAGEFVELRTIADETPACSGSLGLERNVQLRFFAELDALHPVLARPKRLEFDDGTKLELAAGVPVIEHGTKGRIEVGKTQLSVGVSEQDVGRWFFPAPTDASVPPPALREPDLELHYGDQKFVGEWAPFRAAHEAQSIDDGRLLTFSDACGRFVLRTGPAAKEGLYAMKDPKDATPRMAGEFDPDMAARKAGILGVMRQQSGLLPAGGEDDDDVWGGLTGTEVGDCGSVTWTTTPGTALSWLSGGEAGSVLAAHELPSSASEREGRVCFTASGLDVCIESSKLERKELDCETGARLTGAGFGGQGKGGPQVHQAKVEVGEASIATSSCGSSAPTSTRSAPATTPG